MSRAVMLLASVFAGAILGGWVGVKSGGEPAAGALIGSVGAGTMAFVVLRERIGVAAFIVGGTLVGAAIGAWVGNSNSPRHPLAGSLWGCMLGSGAAFAALWLAAAERQQRP